jgi:aminoglycoside 3-N-acetyltransferase
MLQPDGAALLGLWRDLGLREGDLVLCHSYVPSLGRVAGGPGTIVDTLLAALGPSGTLVVPTFTYSWFRGESYDPQLTPGTVGVLGEIVRKRADAVRSADPCFSNAALGARAAQLMRREGPNSFGPGSFYERLLAAEGKVLLIGVDFTALPLFMHLEHVHGVSYRYEKRFTGNIVDAGRASPGEMVHFVRDEHRNPETDRTRISALLDASPACRRVSFAYGEHRCMAARAVAEEVARQLARDPYFLIKQPV